MDTLEWIRRISFTGLLLLCVHPYPTRSRTVRITKPNNLDLLEVDLNRREVIKCKADLGSETYISLGWQFVAHNSISNVDINGSDAFTIVNTLQSDYTWITSLTFKQISYIDEGFYYCHLVTDKGVESAFLEVRVKGPPIIQDSLSTTRGVISAALSDNLKITCFVKARPEATITWFKGPNEITNSFEYTISTDVTQLDTDTKSVLNVFSLQTGQVGMYTCAANNSRGYAQIIWDVKTIAGLSITEPSSNTSVHYGFSINVICRAINFDNTPKIKWYFQGTTTSARRQLRDSQTSSIFTWSEGPSVDYSELSIDEVGFVDEGSYICETGTLSTSVYISVKGRPVVATNTTTLTVLPGERVTVGCDVLARPTVTFVGWEFQSQTLQNGSRTTVYTTIGELHSHTTVVVHSVSVEDYGKQLYCKATNQEGDTRVNIRIKDVNECEMGIDNCDTTLHEICVDTLGSFYCDCQGGYEHNSDTQECEDINECDSNPSTCSQDCINSPGSFRCTCQNGFKLASDAFSCDPVSEPDTTAPPTGSADTQHPVVLGLAIGIPILIIIVVIIVVIICRRQRHRERELVDVPKAKQAPGPVRGFYNTAYNVEGDEAHIYTELQATGDEFPRSRLRFLNLLGEGKFGRVVKAEALSITRNGKWEEVAVKMVKETATDAMKEDFYHELMIVRKIPAHGNVVTYLGCVTASEPTLIIMEYVNGGDLLTYLRKRRPENVGSRSPQQADLSPKDLLSFALQIVRGMAHIASHKIVHRDVAARNVLIDRKHVCKVSDFGLARDVDGADIYERSSRGPLPIRWMAPECLRDSVHTTKSDVWAFGVLLWEIVTLGASPYPGMSGQMVMAAVMEGKRLLCPPQCKQQIYNIMCRCWESSPSKRPSFSNLSRDFERILEEEGDYIQFDQIGEGIYQVLESTRSEELL